MIIVFIIIFIINEIILMSTPSPSLLSKSAHFKRWSLHSAIPWWLPDCLAWRLINPDILMMKTSLLFGWQYVFPSPMYPSLQEHLNEPSVFEQDARLWRQSCDPCTHSSRSKNGKENRLFPEKKREKFHVMGRKKRSETRQTRERERERWREREIKDKRDTYLVKRTTWKFYSGGEKIRNASGHQMQGENERHARQWKKSEQGHVRNFLHKTWNRLQAGSFWKFHVVVVQNNGKEMYKKSVLHVKSCLLIRPTVTVDFHRSSLLRR